MCAVGSRKRQILNWPLPGQGTGATISPFGPPIVANYPPTPNDQGDFVGQLWLVPGATSWVLNRQGNTTNLWQEIGAGTGAVLQLRGDNAGLASPVGGIINDYSGGQGRTTPDVITTASGQTVSTDLRNNITLGDLSNITGSTALELVTGNMLVDSGHINITNPSSGAPGITLTNTYNGAQAGVITMQKSNAGAAVTNNQVLTILNFGGLNPNLTFTMSAQIASIVQAVPSGNVVAADLEFYTMNTSGNLNQRVKITDSGTVIVQAPDSGVGLAVAGGGVTATGPITFPTVYGDTIGSTNLPVFVDSTGLLGTNGGTTGTFTPTITGATTAGTTTYTTQVGKYVKIGNLVMVNGYIVITAATGTGNVVIGTLPFTSNSTTNYNAYGTVAFAGDWTWPTNTTQLIFSLGAATTLATIVGAGSGVDTSYLQMTNAAAGIGFTISYTV